MKIAIFGGSFNPLTKGHTKLTDYLIKNGVVDMVLVMPCYKSLYNKGLETGEHRLEMIRLANRLPQVQPFDWEIKNKIENIGTYDIMKMLEKELCADDSYVGFGKFKSNEITLSYGKKICGMGGTQENNELYFVIGLDNSQKVKKWIKGDVITKDFKFIVVPRKGTEITDTWFMQQPHIYLQDYEADDISSTLVRNQLQKGIYDETVLDHSVFEYIIKHNLYKGG